MKQFRRPLLAVAAAMSAMGLGLWAQNQNAERAEPPAVNAGTSATTGTSPELEPVAMQAHLPVLPFLGNGSAGGMEGMRNGGAAV